MSVYGNERAALIEALPKSAHKHIDKILDTLGYAEAADAVEVIGARLGVETIEAYGLEITLDANGNAAEIRSPHGLDVIA